MQTELLLSAVKVIQKIKYITIASVTPQGKPWNFPVYSAFDTEYNFYWYSWKENQHSLNIAHDPQVFLVIYNSVVPEGTGLGVYIEAKVELVESLQDIEVARNLLQARKDKPSSKLRSPLEFAGDYPRRVYKAVPQRIWVNGSREQNGNYVDTRIELDLKELKKINPHTLLLSAHKNHQELQKELEDAHQKIQVGGLYAHYKHPEKLYKVIQLAFIEATDKLAVVYQAHYNPQLIFVRELESWLEMPLLKGKSVPRFAAVPLSNETPLDEEEVMKALYTRAKELAAKNPTLTPIFLQRKLLVDYFTAKKIMQELKIEKILE